MNLKPLASLNFKKMVFLWLVSPLETLRVIGMIKSFGLDLLSKLTSVYIRRGTLKDLLLLEADEENSRMDFESMQEANGLVLEDQTWKICAFAFRTFYEHSHSLAATLDWDSVTAYELIGIILFLVRLIEDGERGILFWYAGEWRVASARSPEGNDVVDLHFPHRQTFSELFWRLWKEKNYLLPKEKDHNFTFILTDSSPTSQRVVRYPNSRVVLVAVRNLSTLREESIESFALKYHWECSQQFPEITNLAKAEEITREMHPLQAKGFVLIDRHFNRVTVKSLRFSLLTSLRPKEVGKNPTVNRHLMLDIVRVNDDHSYIEGFPEWKQLFQEVKRDWNLFCSLVQTTYDENKHLEKKEFSKRVRKHFLRDAIYLLDFANSDGVEISAKQFFATHQGVTKLRYLVNVTKTSIPLDELEEDKLQL